MLIARTDSMKTHGYEEGVRRANLYAEADADMVMLFPNDADEARRAPRDCNVPLVYVNSSGNRVGRPVFSTTELEEMGYKVDADAISSIIVTYRAVRTMLERLKETGVVGLGPDEAVATRRAIEDTIGLENYYRIEEQTVERGGAT